MALVPTDAVTGADPSRLAAFADQVSTGCTLVVGIDFSEDCERALLHAVALAEQHQAQLALVHVFEWTETRSASDATGECARDEGTDPRGTAVKSHANAARSQLSRLCSALVGDRLAATVRVEIGDPVSRLLHAAEQAQSPLIVLGTHGRRPLPRGKVGSTAQGICASSQVPVLLVPRQPR